VNPAAVAGTPRTARVLRWTGLALMALALGLLAPYLTGGTELVRLRHALVLGDDIDEQSASWQPPQQPAGFLVEQAAPDALFVAVARQLKLDQLPDDWARAMAITAHLRGSAPALLGEALRADLKGTYRGIVDQGHGYCADFIRAFNAIAVAGGMVVRSWAFSFDGYGGHGHIFAEVWNRQARAWQVMDVFNNYYFVDGGEAPLSALAFRRALLAGSAGLQLRQAHSGSVQGWTIESKAWDYYRRGVTQWYLPWGMNPFTFDAQPAVRAFSGLSRAAEQLAAIATGVHPPVRMLSDPGSASQRAHMHALSSRLQWVGLMALLGLMLVLASFFWRRRPTPRDASDAAGAAWPTLCLVGPLPPPSGGMANQCEQLVRLLGQEGATVIQVRTNAPYRPAWVGRLPVVRALFRLLPYLAALWSGIGRAQVVHVFANSGWAWHLLAWPAVLVARWRGLPLIINYRGGLLDEFLSTAPRWVRSSLASVSLRVVPSRFLLGVFGRHGLAAEIIPNIIDLSRFTPRHPAGFGAAPHLIVTRNLEPIYDIGSALRAFAQVRQRFPGARLTVAGTGPDLPMLQALAQELGVAPAVHFAGRIANENIASLYAQADLVLNPSTADNMPISILESLASGVPVVSTDAGGIPDLVQHELSALLVPVGDAAALAAAALRVLTDPALAASLRENGLSEVQRFSWHLVREQWRSAYQRVAQGSRQDRAAPLPSGH
jgi:glycosyltransferase involved in cell wall biosynthesis